MRHTGVILVMLAALLWGISGGIANVLMNRGWSPYVISFYRGMLGFVFFFVWSLSTLGREKLPSMRFFLWSALAGAGVLGNFMFYYLSIEAASISIAITLMYSAPIFVLLFALLFGLERSTWLKWASVLWVMVGIVLLTGAYDPGRITVGMPGALAGLASGLSYTLFIFGFKKASSLGSAKSVLVVAFFSFTVILLFLMDAGETLQVVGSSDRGLFLLLGAIGAGIPFFIYVIGLRKTLPTTASVVAMLEPLTAAAIGILILGNELSAIQLIGGVIVLMSVTLRSVRRSKTEKPLY